MFSKNIHDDNPNLTISQLLGKLDKLVLQHPMTLFLKSLPPYIKLGGESPSPTLDIAFRSIPRAIKGRLAPSEKFWRKFCEFGA